MLFTCQTPEKSVQLLTTLKLHALRGYDDD